MMFEILEIVIFQEIIMFKTQFCNLQELFTLKMELKYFILWLYIKLQSDQSPPWNVGHWLKRVYT